jgi:Uma2 family endonuclease
MSYIAGMDASTSLDPMTVEEFFAFLEGRPDGEKWELIEGMPVRDATGTWDHQRLLGRIFGALHERSRARPWEVLPGFCVQLSLHDVAFPDVLVRPRGGIEMMSCICDDAIVAVEVLSPLTADRDLRWKRQLYPTLPSLQHYIMIAQDDVEVFAYNRNDGFSERRYGALEDVVDFPSMDVSIRIAEIYIGVRDSLQLRLPLLPDNGHALQVRAHQ